MVGVFCLGLLGGIWLQPKMDGLRKTMYSPTATQPQTHAATLSFKHWHVVSDLAVVVMIGGLLMHIIRVTKQEDTSRYVNFIQQNLALRFWGCGEG